MEEKKIISERGAVAIWPLCIHEWRNLSFCMLISQPFIDKNASNLVWDIFIWHTSRKHSCQYCRWYSLYLYEAQSCLILLSEISFFQLWATIFLRWSKNLYCWNFVLHYSGTDKRSKRFKSFFFNFRCDSQRLKVGRKKLR